MHPGVADAAERDEVSRVVVRGITVDMVNMEILLSTTNGAEVSVAFKDCAAYLLPFPQRILVPRPDRGREPFAVDLPRAPRGKRALVAEPAKTVSVGTVGAEGVLRTVKRVQAQLEVGAHSHEEVGPGTR